MSLPHILLGMLAEPSTGYDLKKEFEQSVRHFWSAELSQIYPALSRLEDAGHLRSTTEPSAKGPPRKVYARTDSGLQELVDWLSNGPQTRQERIHYLTQVFFLDAITPEARLNYMRDLRGCFERQLAGLEEVEAAWREDDPSYPDGLSDREFYAHLTLKLGLTRHSVMIQWCDECLERMEARSVSG